MVALQSTHEYVAVVPKKQIKKVLSIASGRTANRIWSFEHRNYFSLDGDDPKSTEEE